MKLYESVLILLPSISIQEVYRITAQYRDLIVVMQGKIFKKEYWGLKKLAYRIKNNTSAHYVFFKFQFSIKSINFLQRELRSDHSIIKFLVIRNLRLTFEDTRQLIV